MDEQKEQKDQEVDFTTLIPKYDIKITSKKQLNNIFMPYISNGGLFIATVEKYALNDFVAFKIQLLDEVEEFVVVGKVVWETPKFAQGGLPQGIGLQFQNKESRIVADKIQNYLLGYIGEVSDSKTM